MLFIVSLPYLYYFYFITGNPLPNSMHSFYGRSFLRIDKLPLGFFGHLFDRSVGMIWVFPWTVFSLIGIYWGLKIDRKKVIPLLVVFFPYYLMTCFSILFVCVFLLRIGMIYHWQDHGLSL